MIFTEIADGIADIHRRFLALQTFIEPEKKLAEIGQLEATMNDPQFWSVQEKAQSTIQRISQLRRPLQNLDNFHRQLEDLEALQQLLAEEENPEGSPHFQDLERAHEEAKNALSSLELMTFLSDPMDANNAIITIHSGAGGTEACDWADMLLRMYVRWAERRKFQVEMQEVQAGEEAGISRATFRLIGNYAYGYAKAERGVHRLVRISPFDSAKRRHTSFCSVDVIGEIADDIDVQIRDEEVRVDTYRASGKGGQHVNKTESAVRLTHLPMGIVVTCQNERSQIKNREMAMKVLRARIYEKMQDEKRSAMEKFYGEKGEIGWGNQIRSYVFQPYQMVKDLRTGIETANLQAVMDGDLDMFIDGWLRAGGPKKRE